MPFFCLKPDVSLALYWMFDCAICALPYKPQTIPQELKWINLNRSFVLLFIPDMNSSPFNELTNV
jgi:hypothetical protein